ncbi:hypothetical protein S40288_01213 [Stachybotrys chartarum IBT 40288]|nr:hypothetical protein S40288_01213 [Stachybotrys chartarum IBT 40288]
MAPTSDSSVKQLLLPLEVAVFAASSAHDAQSHGAGRVELNAPGSYAVGGTTPPVAMLRDVKSRVQLPVRIMIRPRGAPDDGADDFVYSPAEFEQMRAAILAFKATGTMNPVHGDGFVFGILRRVKPAEAKHPGDHLFVDEPRCKELIDVAKPFGCVFHRAFDHIAASPRWAEGLTTLHRCGFKALLTAGGYSDCADNTRRLEAMCERVPAGLQLVVGGGLRGHNARPLATALAGASKQPLWLHSAAIASDDERGDMPGHQPIDTAKLRDLVNALCDARAN